MQSRIKNNLGQISIDNDVIARVAGMAAMGCYGVVGMAAKNVRDGIVQLLKMESLAKGVKLESEDGRLTIGLHIIVEYGTNIAAIADTMISNVKYNVEENVGIKVKEVNIFVEGIRVDL
jgi:uncharacterized alkaline shock family protein YloU